MAMVLAVLLTRRVAGEEDEERSSRRQLMRTCSWTLWRCNRAPRGWRLFQLVFPWLTVLGLCLLCLGVAGHSMFTVDTRASFDGSLGVRDQETRPVTCHPVKSDFKNSVTESSGSFDMEKPSATGFDAGNTELLTSAETGTLPNSLAGEEFVLASCMLPGWTYVLSITPQTEASAEMIIPASSVQEQGVAVSLDWGSNSLTSVSLKFLTLINRQAHKELKVFNIFTTNTQFCTVDFRGAVISPGSKLSIPIAYFVNSIGKAESRMLLQTSAGRYMVETLGEGIPFLYPLLSFMGVSKSELQETVSFFNPFDESSFVEEAYVWVESPNEVSTTYQAKGEGGVLCKRYDSEPESSNPSWLKVRPHAEWFLAPHSSSPIMDLSIMVDDGKHIVGTLFLKIFRHSVQLFEVLVVPMEMEWVSLGISDNKPSAKKYLVELLAVKKQSGWARFLVNSNLLPVQVKNASATGQSDKRLITISVENLFFGVGIESLVADMSLVCFSDKSYLACKLSCLADFYKLITHINSTTHLAVPGLCSALLFYGVSRGGDVDKNRCLANLFKCTEDVYCHKCFDIPSASCKADAREDGILNRKNVIELMFIHAHDLDGRHLSWEYHADLLALVAHSKLWSNVSVLRAKFENLRNTLFTVLSSADLAELTKLGNRQGNEFNLRIVLESSTHASILDSSLSMVSRTWTRSKSRFHMGTLKQHDRPLSKDMDSNILYMMQENSLKEIQKFGCIASYRMGLSNFADCGSEYSDKNPSIFMDLLESDFLEESVAEDCFESVAEDCFDAQCVRILAVLSPPVCHVSLPFSKHQKLVLKLSLLILFSVFVMLIKVLRQEKQVDSDFRLRHSCSHTLFFQSVCLKTGYIKASESSSNFEHSVERLNSASSLECQNDQCYENRIFVVMARVIGSLGCMFRSFFDSQATVLNVRVQISESPRGVLAEQAPNYSKCSLIADQKNCDMRLNSVEKPDNHQTSATAQQIQGISCRESTDTLRVTHFEANTSPSVSLTSAHPITEDVSLTRSVIDIEKVQCKERKEKGKRKKRRSNIIDLKQESERMGQSGSSSPPSSPASPATPLAYSPISPFLQPGSPASSRKGSTHSSGHSSSFRDPTPRSTFVQFSSETLSQLDVRADHTCNSASKGRLQQHHLYTLGSKASLEPLPTRMAAGVKTVFCGKGSVRNDTRKDTSAGENWAAVARRAIATPSEADRWQGLSSSSRRVKNDGTPNKPVLLPLATFPQSGRSMQWNPQTLEERSFTLNDPMSSPSLISTSLVAPNARAPGTRPANNFLQAAAGQLEVGSTVTSTGLRMHEGPKRDDFLYDIWGNHFAQISCRTQTDLFSSDAIPVHDTVEITSPAFPKMGSFFAASDLTSSALTQGSADATVGRSISIPSAGFSVFSCDTFFSPYQCKDAAGSSTP